MSTPHRIPVRRGWDPLLLFLAGYLLVSVGRVHQLFPSLEPLRLGLIIGAGAITLYLLDQGEARRLKHVLRLRTTAVLFALLVWMALSVPAALWPGRSFQVLIDLALTSALMYAVMVGALRDEGDVERLALVFFLAAVIYAAVVLVRFDAGSGAWHLGSLTYYDANDFATLAVAAMPLGLHFALGRRTVGWRWASALGLVLLIVAFVRSGSRGGFVAFLVVAMYVLPRHKAIPARWRISAAVLLALLFAATATDAYWQRVRTLANLEQDYNVTGPSGRVQVWSRGIGYMLANPMFGVGPGNFETAEGMISPLARLQERGIGVKWSAAHNSFVQVGAELGFPGLLLFAAMIGSVLVALCSIRRAPRDVGRGACDARALAQTLTGSWIGFLVGAFFLSLAYSEMLYTLLALSAGLRKATSRAVRPGGAVRAQGFQAAAWLDRAQSTGDGD